MKVVVAFLLLSSIASAADVFLVRTDGVYKREVAFPPGSIVIGIGDTPPAPPPPSGATVREKVAALSKSLLTGIQAAPIAAIVQGTIGSATPRTSLIMAVTDLGDLGLFPGHKFSTWLANVDALHEGEYTDAFLKSVTAGILDAFTPPAGGQSVAQAFDFQLVFKIIGCIIGNLPEGATEAERALNFQLIFKIISCVIGNLPGDAIAAEGEPILAPLPDDGVSNQPAVDPAILNKLKFTSVLLNYDGWIRSPAEQAALMELAKTRGLVGAR